MRGRLEPTATGWMVLCRSHSCTVTATGPEPSSRFQEFLERHGWTCAPVDGSLLWRCRRCSR